VSDIVVIPGAAIEQLPGADASGSILRYAAVKLAGTLVSLALLAMLAFFLFRMLPGDPVAAIARDRPLGADQMNQLRNEWGLDRPLSDQFGHYLKGLAHGDLGTSYQYRKPVATMIGARLWPTILLTGTATVLSAALGIWLGTRAAWRYGSRQDRALTGAALVFWSVPTFWLGLILLYALAAGHGPIPPLFPHGGMSSADSSGGFLLHTVDVLHHLTLPCLTLVAVLHAQYLTVMRASLIEEMSADYLTTARAIGLREDLVRRRHAVPNALLPTVTLVFLNLGSTVAGAVAVETVFSWPGLGRLTYEALSGPDLPLLQGCFLVLAGSLIFMNLAADMLHRVLDPRIRIP
jgi:peptide/nickel transport system permease protein